MFVTTLIFFFFIYDNVYKLILIFVSYFKNFKNFYFIDVRVNKLVFLSSFQDSGIVDFFLLSIYDMFFRYFFVYSLLILSEFSIIEKASWRFFSYLSSGISNYTFFEIINIWEFFFTLLVLFVSLFSFFFFIQALFL